jgi:hypothetical protein
MANKPQSPQCRTKGQYFTVSVLTHDIFCYHLPFMNGKLAMTYLKYQVCLYGSEAITYLNAFLWVVTEPAL